MPLQNRVAPDGSIFSSAARGTLMGNRGGRFHRDDRTLGQRRWASRQWICCALNFRDRHRTVWDRGYTELFFCDEVSALAAGHRPCFECRRSDAIAFAEAVQRGLAAPMRPSAPDLDERLQQERLSGREKRVYALPPRMPDGIMIADRGCFYAFRHDRWLRWNFSSYCSADITISPDAKMLTPPTMLAALLGGYQPQWHPSAE